MLYAMLMLFGILILLVDMTMRKLARSPSHVCLTNFTKTVTLLEDEKAAEGDSRLGITNGTLPLLRLIRYYISSAQG